MSEMRQAMEQEKSEVILTLEQANRALLAVFGIAEEDEE